MSNLSQNTRWTVRDSNPVPSKQKPVFVPPFWSVETVRDNWNFYLSNSIIGLVLFKLRRAWICPSSLLFKGYGRLFLGVKRPGRETDYSLPSSAEVKNDAAIFRLPQTQSLNVRGQFYLSPGHAQIEPVQTGSEWAFPYTQRTSTTEP